MTQPVGASRTAFSGRFASTAVEDVASHPNRLSRCARRSDDTEARSGLARLEEPQALFAGCGYKVW
jgi:hypothetical protein